MANKAPTIWLPSSTRVDSGNYQISWFLPHFRVFTSFLTNLLDLTQNPHKLLSFCIKKWREWAPVRPCTSNYTRDMNLPSFISLLALLHFFGFSLTSLLTYFSKSWMYWKCDIWRSIQRLLSRSSNIMFATNKFSDFSSLLCWSCRLPSDQWSYFLVLDGLFLLFMIQKAVVWRFFW